MRTSSLFYLVAPLRTDVDLTTTRVANRLNPLDQRSHIGFSVLLAELDEAAFSMPGLFAPSDDVQPVGNVDVWPERKASSSNAELLSRSRLAKAQVTRSFFLIYNAHLMAVQRPCSGPFNGRGESCDMRELQVDDLEDRQRMGPPLGATVAERGPHSVVLVGGVDLNQTCKGSGDCYMRSDTCPTLGYSFQRTLNGRSAPKKFWELCQRSRVSESTIGL
jgi:hypothetical protein